MDLKLMVVLFMTLLGIIWIIIYSTTKKEVAFVCSNIWWVGAMIVNCMR